MKNAIQRRRLKITATSNTVKDYPNDTILQPKPLYLVMQKVWFDEIEKGVKIEEYRDGSQFYKSRFCNLDKKSGEILSFKKYNTVILQEGYHVGARRMIVKVEGISLKRDFTIHLGEILERINF